MDTKNLATYGLDDGAIRHWLACGTMTSPLQNLEQVIRPDGSPYGDKGRWVLNYWAFDPRSATLKARVYKNLPPFTWQPTNQPALKAPAIRGKLWEYATAEEDNVIDFSRFNFTPTLMEACLYAGLKVDLPLTVQAEMLTIGPVRIWLNGKLLLHYAEHFSYVAIQRIPLTLTLNPGINDLYVYGEMLGWREARLALGMRFVNNPPIEAALPLGSILAEHWHTLESDLSRIRLKQFAFPKLPAYISLDADGGREVTVEATVSLPYPDNAEELFTPPPLPIGQAQLKLSPGGRAELPITHDILEAMSHLAGENTVSLTLRPVDGTPLAIHREIWASENQFSLEPYGDYESRRREVLEHLAQMAFSVPAAMAAVEIGKATTISSEAIALACHYLNHRYDCADFFAIGLLALLNRFGDSAALQLSDQTQIEEAFRNFKFWLDEPGLDAMCYFTENHQVLFHVVAYLAGQRWPEQVFLNSGWTGKEQQSRARPRIESWILRRLQGNFSEWDSNAYMALDVFAMLALVEYADSPRLQEMATTLLHKIFFMVACQSFRGVHGSTHGRCYVTGLKSGRVENTSSLQRLGWGMGILNGETRATALLALTQRYRIPNVIQAIGADMAPALVTRVRSKADYRPHFDFFPGEWDVRTITRRTPDYMLSAAVDYRPGEMGIQEHLWQATFSPEAVVFTSYPGNSQEHGNARPNYWAGSACLPRVAMHDRTIICLYPLETNVGLGFSHAYFPTAMFDEYTLMDRWAFARKGKGYIALCGDGELSLQTEGNHAGQELRSQSRGYSWIAYVGSEPEDGDFAGFRKKLMGLIPRIEKRQVTWTTPNGETLDFAWQGALDVNGKPEDWDHFPHYENAYTQTPLGAQQMVIQHAGTKLVLDLKHGRVI